MHKDAATFKTFVYAYLEQRISGRVVKRATFKTVRPVFNPRTHVYSFCFIFVADAP